jgi:hypothetical protein
MSGVYTRQDMRGRPSRSETDKLHSSKRRVVGLVPITFSVDTLCVLPWDEEILVFVCLSVPFVEPW